VISRSNTNLKFALHQNFSRMVWVVEAEQENGEKEINGHVRKFGLFA